MTINKPSKLISMLGAGALTLGLGGVVNAQQITTYSQPDYTNVETQSNNEHGLGDYLIFGLGALAFGLMAKSFYDGDLI